MSSSLVKQSLSLFDDDLNDPDTEKKTTKKKSQKDPMLLISTNKRGVKKELKKLKKKLNTNSQSNIKRKSLHDFEPHQEVDYTEQSVDALNRLSKITSTNKAVTKVVFDHHQSKRRRPLPEKETKDETTAFTEDDFADFAKDFDFDKLK